MSRTFVGTHKQAADELGLTPVMCIDPWEEHPFRGTSEPCLACGIRHNNAGWKRPRRITKTNWGGLRCGHSLFFLDFCIYLHSSGPPSLRWLPELASCALQLTEHQPNLWRPPMWRLHKLWKNTTFVLFFIG